MFLLDENTLYYQLFLGYMSHPRYYAPVISFKSFVFKITAAFSYDDVFIMR